jgi:FtsZ-binding cell division protein ZapB
MKDKIKELKLQHQINTLENENETLKNIIKEELYREFIEYTDIKEENDRLKETNKKLRNKIKGYQSKDYKKEK